MSDCNDDEDFAMQSRRAVENEPCSKCILLSKENERLRKAESVIATRRFALIKQECNGGLIMEERAVLEVLTEIAMILAPAG